jgi:hypothetical protein
MFCAPWSSLARYVRDCSPNETGKCLWDPDEGSEILQSAYLTFPVML